MEKYFRGIVGLVVLCVPSWLLSSTGETPFAREHRIVREKLDELTGQRKKTPATGSWPNTQSLDNKEAAFYRLVSALESAMNIYDTTKDKKAFYATIQEIINVVPNVIKNSSTTLDAYEQFKNLTQKDKEHEIIGLVLAYTKDNNPALSDDPFFQTLTNAYTDYALTKLRTTLNLYKTETDANKKSKLGFIIRFHEGSSLTDSFDRIIEAIRIQSKGSSQPIRGGGLLSKIIGNKAALALYRKELAAAGLDKDPAFSFSNAKPSVEAEQKGKFEVDDTSNKEKPKSTTTVKIKRILTPGQLGNEFKKLSKQEQETLRNAIDDAIGENDTDPINQGPIETLPDVPFQNFKQFLLGTKNAALKHIRQYIAQ